MEIRTSLHRHPGSLDESNKMLDDPGFGSRQQNEHRQLITEMKSHNFDAIRFASYRTACKLRYVQKRSNLYLVDIWNMIEAFRDNGLNILEPRSEIKSARLETVLTSIYYQLNKRLPSSQEINVETSTTLLLNWLLAAYDSEDTGKVRVFSIKVALSVMCSGKLMDKLRYIYSQISDNSGMMVHLKFQDFLQEVLRLPTAVFEAPSFSYTDAAANAVFDDHEIGRVTVNDFLDTLISEPGPPCIVWLPLLHRFANVENVLHPIACDGCQRDGFLGFRYKCHKCNNYQLCQDCFWRGTTTGNHLIEHDVKEYTTFKSPSKQFGHSLRKSFRCVPEKKANTIPKYPDQPEKPLNLSHIVPPSPLPNHNGFPNNMNHSFDISSIDSRSTSRSVDLSRVDDEHRLIARYAARLAADVNNATRSPSELSVNQDTTKSQRKLVMQLEAKNREIVKEISRLRHQQELDALVSAHNPQLVAELQGLREKKDELETTLVTLQDSRRELMLQLENLMKLLKNHHIISPRSTPPNSSPRSPLHTNPTPGIPSGILPVASSTPTTTATPHSEITPPNTPPSSISPPTSMTQQQITITSPPNAPTSAPITMTSQPAVTMPDTPPAFIPSPFPEEIFPQELNYPPRRPANHQTSHIRNLQADLLQAADSVTNQMSTLVKELNSDSDEEKTDNAVSQDTLSQPRHEDRR